MVGLFYTYAMDLPNKPFERGFFGDLFLHFGDITNLKTDSPERPTQGTPALMKHPCTDSSVSNNILKLDECKC